MEDEHVGMLKLPQTRKGEGGDSKQWSERECGEGLKNEGGWQRKRGLGDGEGEDMKGKQSRKKKRRECKIQYKNKKKTGLRTYLKQHQWILLIHNELCVWLRQLSMFLIWSERVAYAPSVASRVGAVQNAKAHTGLTALRMCHH